MFSKVVTKAGPDQSPIYAWLGQDAATCRSGTSASTVIGKDGKVVAFFPSKVTPDAPELRQAIESALEIGAMRSERHERDRDQPADTDDRHRPAPMLEQPPLARRRRR